MRGYGQSCGLACALDVLGERWALLVLRELMLGPKRFGALREALPGVGNSMLSARVKRLVDEGLVEEVELPAPASVRAYALTDEGERLRPALEALSAWGLSRIDPSRALGDDSRGRARASLMAATLAGTAAQSGARVDPDDDERLAAFDVDGDRFTIRLRDGRAHVRHGEPPDDDVPHLVCDLKRFVALARGTRRPPRDLVPFIRALRVPADRWPASATPALGSDAPATR